MHGSADPIEGSRHPARSARPGGIDLGEVPSPCFVLEEARLRENLALLRKVERASGARILVALKGFAVPAVFPLIREHLSGAAVSALNEARLAFEELGGDIHACAPAYLSREIDEILEYVSHLTFNSLSQWERYRSRVLRRDDVSAGIRINPEHSEVRTALYDPAQPGSRLGVTAEELHGRLPEGIDGLHFHSLCECDADALERTLTVIETTCHPLLEQASWLNLGGGHLITRPGYDVETLVRLVRNLRDRYGVEVILEPGAAVAWKTGVLAALVADIVEHRGIRTLILDVSFSAHMPDCLEMPYRPAVRGARDPTPGERGCRLGGSTCLAGDYVGDYVFDTPPAVGDRIVFEDMMHYTLVKSTYFNGVPHPSIGIWREEGGFELLRRFGYEDYRDRLG